MKYIKLVLVAILVLGITAVFAATAQKVAVLDFEPEERASRTTASQMMHQRRGDFTAIFDNYDQYELISMNDVSKALSSLGVTGVRYLTSQMAVDIGRELNADILVWGTLSEVSPTEIRVVANIMSVRSGNINQLRFNVSKRSADRRATLRTELIDKIAEFAGGEIVRLFDIGEQQLNSQNFTGARSTFLRVTQIDPENVDAWFYLGYIAFMLNDYEACIEYSNICLDIFPNDERVLNNLAEAQLQMGRNEEAIGTLKRLAEVNPDDEVIWLRIANIYIEINALYEGIESLQKALVINPENERAHYRLGVLLFDNNEIDESITHLEFVAELHPEDAGINRRLTAAYMRTGQLNQAIQNYRNQIERNPQNVTAYLNLAGALRTQEQNREALDTLNKLAQFDKDNPTVHIRLADVNIALNRINEAETNALTAGRLDPELYEPYTLLAQINQVRGFAKYEQFIELEEKAKEAFGREADALIDQRDNARNEANDLFRKSDELLATALTKTNEPSIVRDIRSRRQLLEQLITETRRTFFD